MQKLIKALAMGLALTFAIPAALAQDEEPPKKAKKVVKKKVVKKKVVKKKVVKKKVVKKAPKKKADDE
jgi:hypothetical protein